MDVTHVGGVLREREGITRGAVAGCGTLALALGLGAAPWRTAVAAGTLEEPRDVVITSPRPFFMQLPGQGPALSGTRVVWTATNGEGQTGSSADRIYAYDLGTRHLSVPMRSHYGTMGFVGSFSLVGSRLAYVDTGFSPGGVFAWRVAIVDLGNGQTQTLASSDAHSVSTIPPQIAFDGTHVLMVQTTNLGSSNHGATATLFTLSSHSKQIIAHSSDVEFADPALADHTALWTTVTFGAGTSSRLSAFDMARRQTRTLPVGNVSELAASGDMVIWKSGAEGMGGHIGLYSLSQHRLISSNLAGSSRAIFPSIGGRLAAWTYGDGSRVQIYSLGSERVIYTTPTVKQRVYGPTAVAPNAVSWVYTTLAAHGSSSRGYVVVHAVR